MKHIQIVVPLLAALSSEKLLYAAKKNWILIAYERNITKLRKYI